MENVRAARMRAKARLLALRNELAEDPEDQEVLHAMQQAEFELERTRADGVEAELAQLSAESEQGAGKIGLAGAAHRKDAERISLPQLPCVASNARSWLYEVQATVLGAAAC